MEKHPEEDKKDRARSKVAIWFEGGQMPLHRRLPKRGFTNIFAKKYTEVRLDNLAEVFDAGAQVDAKVLLEAGFISKLEKDGIKILGNGGELDKALHVTAAKFTKSAAQKIGSSWWNSDRFGFKVESIHPQEQMCSQQ